MDGLHNGPYKTMKEQLPKAKRYHNAIHNILLHDWDPIGVADEPNAQDEYDGYIYEIYGMLIRREPRHRLIDHLLWIETEHMGLFGNRSRTVALADRLIRLVNEIGTET